MPKKLLLITLFLLTVTLSFAANKKNVLVVCPYSLSGTWAKNTIEPITELDKDKMNITPSLTPEKKIQ